MGYQVMSTCHGIALIPSSVYTGKRMDTIVTMAEYIHGTIREGQIILKTIIIQLYAGKLFDGWTLAHSISNVIDF